jgi:dolichol-phosphate mannosyltransferase
VNLESSFDNIRARPADQDGEIRLLPVPRGPFVIPSETTRPPSGIVLSLVLPTYNEKDNLPKLVKELVGLLDPVLRDRYELLVVDDDSSDLTWQVALNLAGTFPQLRVMRRQDERGLSTAAIRGWQAARGEYLGVMDADLQHPPAVNLRLVEEIQRGAELAVGSRHVEGGGVSTWSLARRILSRGAQFLGLVILPSVVGRLSDPMSGYFIFRRSALAGVELDPIGYKILLEVLARGKVRWLSEVGYVFREREDGASKVTASIYLQYFRHLLRLRLVTLPSSRLFRFCVVGGTGVMVDMSLLYMLSDPSMLQLGLTRSKLVAASCAMVSNFLLNDAWTFGDLAQRSRSPRAKFRRFLGFAAICSVGIVLNALILNVQFNLGMNRYVANLFAILAVTAWNYWLNLKLNWAPLSTDDS